MSLATAVGSVAAINATTTPFAFAPFQGNFTLPPASVPAAATVPSLRSARDPLWPPAPRRRLRRRAYVYRAEGRREARIYSWASRRFLAVDPRSEAVTLSNHGNSVYGMLALLFIYLLYGFNTRYVIHCNSEESQVCMGKSRIHVHLCSGT